uniref:Tc1-like transposase DDE domain-containing protein n=1 Tax=Cyprinus carpio carpio TaxID=630221 RepID=A0A9J8B307_CYPCA
MFWYMSCFMLMMLPLLPTQRQIYNYSAHLFFFSAACLEFGLQISLKKTVILAQPATLNPTVYINNICLSVVDKFTYLGSTVSNNNNLDAELDMRIGRASSMFGKLNKHVWHNKYLSLLLKVCVYHARVLSTLLYASETRTTYRRYEHRLNAFHFCCLRSILGVCWKDHVPNSIILERTGSSDLYPILREHHLHWTGHIYRMNDTRLPKILLYGELANAPRKLHKEWIEGGVKASRATTHRHVKEFGYSCRIPLVKPLLNHRQCQRRLTWTKEKKNWTVAQWSKVLFSDESKFCISFGNQGPRVWRKGGEAHSPSCLKSSVKFPESVMIWGAMSSAGVGPLCFLKTKVTAPIYQEILEHFMLSSADQLFEDADFIFQQDLAPAHTAKSTKSWLNDHVVGVLDWPANSPDLNPIENLWGTVKRKMRNKRPKNADELKATAKESWASIPPQQCHKLITSMPRRIEAVIKAKGAPTKY